MKAIIPTKKNIGTQEGKTTLAKLIMAHRVVEEHAKDKVSVKLGMKLYKFRVAVKPEEEFYEQEMAKIIAEYGQKDKDGNPKFDEKGNVPIEEKRLEECKARIAELDGAEVDMPAIEFTVDELSELKLSMNDIAYLADFIREEE